MKLLGEAHPEIQATADRLLPDCCRLKEYNEAREELDHELERRKDALGKEHPDT